MKFVFLRTFQISSLVLGLGLMPISLQAMECSQESSFHPRIGRSLTAPEPLRKSPTARKTSLESHYPPTRAFSVVRILVIEDNEITANVINSIITKFLKGDYLYEIIYAKNGHDGIRFYRQKRPVMTLCDFNLEGDLNGEQIRNLINKDCEQDQPGMKPSFFVAISAEEENNKKMKPDYICQKPLKRKELEVATSIAFQGIPKYIFGEAEDK